MTNNAEARAREVLAEQYTLLDAKREIMDGGKDRRCVVGIWAALAAMEAYGNERAAQEREARLSTDAEVLRDRQEYSPADDENSRAFIDGWNARLDHTDFDMALHYWMLAGAALSPTIDSAPSKEWCLRMAELEEDHEIGAGMPDHPLRMPPTIDSADGGGEA